MKTLCFYVAFLSALAVGTVNSQVPDLCGSSLDECYEEEVRQILSQVEKDLHRDIVQLCTALRNNSLSNCANVAESCQANDPWRSPIVAVIEALCTEENIRLFSTPLVPSAQCFHISYAFQCIPRNVKNYEALTDYIRSHRNDDTCRRIIDAVSDCTIGVFDICPDSENLDRMKQALLRVAHVALNATGCNAQLLNAAEPSVKARQSECEAHMTRITACLKDIISPNTVAGELLEKIRTRPRDYDQTFCRTYENVLMCKKNLTVSTCYSEAARNALAKNIAAFSSAKDFLCDSNRTKIREFAEALRTDQCNPDDDLINDCSRNFVRSVSSSEQGARDASVNRAFDEQIKCIRNEFRDCKVGPARQISKAFFDTAAAAFKGAGGGSDRRCSSAISIGLSLLAAVYLLSY